MFIRPRTKRRQMERDAGLKKRGDTIRCSEVKLLSARTRHGPARLLRHPLESQPSQSMTAANRDGTER